MGFDIQRLVIHVHSRKECETAMDFFRSFGYEPNAMTPDKWYAFSYICLIKSFRDVGSWILSAYAEADHISRDKYDPILEFNEWEQLCASSIELDESFLELL